MHVGYIYVPLSKAKTETIYNTVPPEFQPSMLEDWKF